MRIQRGFTIVELLIVVVVIAILVGISYTAYTGIIDHTYDTRKAADIRNFEIELSQYKEQHGCLPGECTADLRQPSGRLADGLQYYYFILCLGELDYPDARVLPPKVPYAPARSFYLLLRRPQPQLS